MKFLLDLSSPLIIIRIYEVWFGSKLPRSKWKQGLSNPPMIPVCYDTNSKKKGKCVASNQPTCSQYLYDEENKETEEDDDEQFYFEKYYLS